MVLRDYDIATPRRGELLLDYNTYDLYYVKMDTGERIRLADEIYQRILAARVQNTFIDINDADKQDPVPGENEVWPPISERQYNHFNYIVRGRIPIGSVEDDSEQEGS